MNGSGGVHVLLGVLFVYAVLRVLRIYIDNYEDDDNRRHNRKEDGCTSAHRVTEHGSRR